MISLFELFVIVGDKLYESTSSFCKDVLRVCSNQSGREGSPFC
jgi:hypothetical protein